MYLLQPPFPLRTHRGIVVPPPSHLRPNLASPPLRHLYTRNASCPPSPTTRSCPNSTLTLSMATEDHLRWTCPASSRGTDCTKGMPPSLHRSPIEHLNLFLVLPSTMKTTTTALPARLLVVASWVLALLSLLRPHRLQQLNHEYLLCVQRCTERGTAPPLCDKSTPSPATSPAVQRCPAPPRNDRSHHPSPTTLYSKSSSNNSKERRLPLLSPGRQSRRSTPSSLPSHPPPLGPCSPPSRRDRSTVLRRPSRSSNNSDAPRLAPISRIDELRARWNVIGGSSVVPVRCEVIQGGRERPIWTSMMSREMVCLTMRSEVKTSR